MNDCSEIKTNTNWQLLKRLPTKIWDTNMSTHIPITRYKHVRGCVLRKVKVFLLKGRQSFPLYRRSNFDTYRTPEYAERPSTSIVWDTVIIIVTIVNYGCNQLIDIFFSLTTIGYRNYLILSNSSSIFF